MAHFLVQSGPNFKPSARSGLFGHVRKYILPSTFTLISRKRQFTKATSLHKSRGMTQPPTEQTSRHPVICRRCGKEGLFDRGVCHWPLGKLAAVDATGQAEDCNKL